MTSKKVLITGSQGNIGKAMERVSENYDCELYGCDCLHLNKKHYQRADIGEYREIEECVKKFRPEIIVNLAGEFGRANGEDYYEKLWKTNAVGTKNLTILQKEYNFRLVHASSSEVYGDYDGLMRESVMDEFPIKQLNDYAISKWVNELQLRNSILKDQADTIIFRIFNTYGPGELFNQYRSAVSRFIHCCLCEEPYNVFTGHERTHTYIDDCARMIFEISLRGKKGEVYNIAGRDRTTMVKINEMIEKICCSKSPYRKIINEKEPFTTAIKTVSNEKFLNLVGDFQFTPLEVGLNNTIKWYKNYLQTND